MYERARSLQNFVAIKRMHKQCKPGVPFPATPGTRLVQSESSLITTTLYIIYYVTTDLISHE